MSNFLKLLKTIAVWFGLFFLTIIVSAIVLPKNDGLTMFVVAIAFFLPTAIASKRFPIRDLYGDKWYAFTTIFRYILDAVPFVVIFSSLFNLVSKDDTEGIWGLALLFLTMFSAYLVNFKRINKTFKYLNGLSSGNRTKLWIGRPNTRPYSPTPSNGTSSRFDFHSVNMSRIDSMGGHEFEYFVADLLRKLGYQDVEVTRGSGDQGVDVLATKDGVRYAVQCKCYSSDLGNKPVQEVHTGKSIYHCHVGVVVTNRYFTAGAKEAAAATGVLLWDRDTLGRMMNATQIN